MKTKLILLCLMLSIVKVSVLAQTPHSPFESNVVKIKNKGRSEAEPQYGFITGDNPGTKTIYFVMIYPKKSIRVKESHEVMFDNESESSKSVQSAFAKRVAGVDQIKLGNFILILYEINSNRKINKNFYRPINTASFDGYKLLTDLEDGVDNFDVYVNKAEITRFDSDVNSNKSVTFIIPIQYRKSKPGLPVLNQSGVVCGLTAISEEDKTKFEVLDISGIREQLYKAGGIDECKYFNLIEEGKTITPCQQRANDLQADAQKRKAEEERLRSLSLKEKRRILADKNYLIAMSATGGLNINGHTQTNASSTSSYGTAYGYQLGADVYILPDWGLVSLALRPRYSAFGISAGTDYVNESNSNFTWSTARFTSVEVPVLIDFKQRNKSGGGNYFFGVGYVLGRQRNSNFKFTESGTTQKQEILSNPTLVKKVMAEVGIEQGKFRLTVFGAYQMTPLLRKDYELILSGATVRPFENSKTGSFAVGLELSIRLWGRWQNGIIY